MIEAAKEAMRVVRVLDMQFPTGPGKTGSAFLAPAQRKLLTCAHVVTDDKGQRPSLITVRKPGGASYESTLLSLDAAFDLATLEAREDAAPAHARSELPQVGESVIFAGSPQGVARSSVFPGMVSAVGAGLISFPKCDVVQIAGMINNGNSGGPLLDRNGAVLGVITAKYVPLLREIDKLRQDLEQIPQFPRNVGIGGVDFSAFVNMTVKSMWQIAAVLRLVQVGTGWAVPATYFSKVGGV